MASSNDSSVFFPKQEPAQGPRIVLEALVCGTLAAEDGCLRLKAPEGTSYLPIWPPDFELITGGDEVRVLDGEGRIVARVGSRIELGGGDMGTSVAGLASASDRLKRELHERCLGPFWLVGEHRI